MSYVDPESIHNPTAGTAPPAAWGDTVRANQELFANRPRWVLSDLNTPGPDVTNSVVTYLEYETPDVADSHGFHNPASDPEEVVIPAGYGGLYLITVHCSWEINGSGSRICGINAAGTIHSVAQPGGGLDVQNCTLVTSLAPGSVVRHRVQQTSGVALEITNIRFTGVWLGL